MKSVFWALASVALIAAAPPEPPQTARHPAPGHAPSAEPCLTDPFFSIWREPGSQPADWSGCTAEQAEAAIVRQCALDEPSGTVAHEMCLSRRRDSDALRRSDQASAAPPPTDTTREAADHACRGQTWRRPGETRQVCIDRLIATDALSRPLPQARPAPAPRCRRESVRSEDGTGFSVSVTCTETTVVPTPPG